MVVLTVPGAMWMAAEVVVTGMWRVAREWRGEDEKTWSGTYILWNGPLARAPHRGWAAEAALGEGANRRIDVSTLFLD